MCLTQNMLYSSFMSTLIIISLFLHVEKLKILFNKVEIRFLNV